MRKLLVALGLVAALAALLPASAGAQPFDPCEQFIGQLPFALPVSCAGPPVGVYPTSTDPLLRGGLPRVSTYDPDLWPSSGGVAVAPSAPGNVPPSAAFPNGAGAGSGGSSSTPATGTTVTPNGRRTQTNTGFDQLCRDGTVSTAGGRQGACSGHGGVAR